MCFPRRLASKARNVSIHVEAQLSDGILDARHIGLVLKAEASWRDGRIREFLESSFEFQGDGQLEAVAHEHVAGASHGVRKASQSYHLIDLIEILNTRLCPQVVKDGG